MEKPANIEIYNELKRRIIEMEYKPGQLLNEKELIEEFKVSRTPIREAILKLSQKKLIEIRPRVGTYVSQVDIQSIKHIYEVKKNLEGLVAELAAKRASEEEIQELFNSIERINQYDSVRDYKKCIREDQLFHKITRQASRNPILIECLEDFSIKTSRFLQYIQYKVDDYEWYKESLEAIAYAIKEGDAKRAAQAAEHHTEAFLEKLSKSFFS